MKIYKVGILGLHMGNGWAESVSRRKDAQLIVVFDPDQEQNRKIAEKYKSRPAASEDEFFDTDLDIVIVATPDHLHVPQSIHALSLGRHVICEKPMAATVKDCQVINAAVRRYKKYFMIGQVCRFTPAFRVAKKLICKERIGNIAFIESEYYHDYSGVSGVNGWRKDPKIRREGFIGGGCHALDLIRWLAGDPEEVFCYMNQKYLTDWPTKDSGVAVMKFKGGAIGKVFVSTGVKAGYSMRTVIHGTKGSIVCDNTSPTMDLFDEDYRQITRANPWKIPVKVNNHNVSDEFAEFVDCLKAGRRPPTDEYEGTNTVAFGEACLKSARTGKSERVQQKVRKQGEQK